MATWEEIVERARVVKAGHSRSLVEDAQAFAEHILEIDATRSRRACSRQPNPHAKCCDECPNPRASE